MLVLTLLLPTALPSHAEDPRAAEPMSVDGVVTEPSEEVPPSCPASAGIGDPWLYRPGSAVVIESPDLSGLAEKQSEPGPHRVGVLVDLDLRSSKDGQWTRLSD